MIIMGLVLVSLTGASVCSSIEETGYGENVPNDKGAVETSPGAVETAAAGDGIRLVRRSDPIFDLLESMLGVFDNKPKMKTVLSLTEVVDPKKWPERRCSAAAAAAGKDSMPMPPPDPFLFDQWFPFKPLSFDHPRQPVERNVSGDDAALTGLDLSRSFLRLDRPKRHGDTCVGARDQDVAQPLSDCSLEFDLNKADQGAADEGRGCGDVLLTSLPFIEGALGGIFLVLLVLLMASLRGKRSNAIWTRVPFVDKSQFTEKV